MMQIHELLVNKKVDKWQKVFQNVQLIMKLVPLMVLTLNEFLKMVCYIYIYIVEFFSSFLFLYSVN